nr:pollen-specific leucine-rich repeat extensin-like protein 4 [Ipomoea batatas]
MPINTESTPPPRIGKIGPYTVFITPPSTPTPHTPSNPPAASPTKPQPQIQTPPPAVKTPPPVMVPPKQYDSYPTKPHSAFGFFWDAVAKVQIAHASLDESVAYWFGLNQSKYQWALDDYYESKGIGYLEMDACKMLPRQVDVTYPVAE